MQSAVHFRLGPAVAIIALWLSAVPCVAGGVRAVAGNGFEPAARGKPLKWPNGTIRYYTDQGKLGALTQEEANGLVADAFSHWISVPTAALTATRAGSLDEDVNGTNVFLLGDTLALPEDIKPEAVTKPVAIVYDDDGAVTDALLGAGASAPAACTDNGVIGGPDAHNIAGDYTHALVIINGRCVSGSAELLRIRYLLLRVIGQTLGLGWSQLNDNVATGDPPPTPADIAGVPVMHPLPVLCSIVLNSCVPDADQLRLDDRAAIASLYPVTPENAHYFPGKQMFASSTATITGNVRFALPNGLPGQPMQGVNVVARLIDPITGLPSPTVACSSVSGFLFRGNAGNRATGFNDPIGGRYDDFGSADPEVEGYFELRGLEFPAGTESAQFQITLEPINSLYADARGVGPYRDFAVQPSGSTPALSVPVTRGATASIEVNVVSSAALARDRLEPNSFLAPTPIPASGEWTASISGYGDEDFFAFTARAGRTFDFRLTALDEKRQPTTRKMMPVAGVWLGSDTPASPARVAATPFNALSPATTQLQASTNTNGMLKIGIMDSRGDGRPDFLYRGRLLYVDTATPAQVPPNQATAVLLRGIGFRPGMTVSVGGTPATVLFVRPEEIAISAPALTAGSYDVAVNDHASGAHASITNGLTYGAANDDAITDLSIANLTVPVGMTAPNPMRVRVSRADGGPVSGAAVIFSVSPPESHLGCGSNPCTLLTDGNGEVSTTLLVNAAGSNAVTAQLSNGASVARNFVGSTMGAILTALTPFIYVAAGDTVSLPIQLRYSENASPVANVSVVAGVLGPGASLTTSAPVTDANGLASTTLNIVSASTTVNMTGCVSATSACAQMSVLPQPADTIQLLAVAGDRLKLLVGESAAVRFRVAGAAPAFVPITQTTVNYSVVVTTPMQGGICTEEAGCPRGEVRVLSSAAGTVKTDGNGIVNISPVLDPTWGAVHVLIHARTASGAERIAEFDMVQPAP